MHVNTVMNQASIRVPAMLAVAALSLLIALTACAKQEAPLHKRLKGTIFEAARKGEVEKVRGFLVGDPALLNARDLSLWTPLHHASHNGNAEVVVLLLEHGANPKAETNFYWTPLDVARHRNHKAVERILLIMLEQGALPPDILLTLSEKYTADQKHVSVPQQQDVADIMQEPAIDAETGEVVAPDPSMTVTAPEPEMFDPLEVVPMDLEPMEPDPLTADPLDPVLTPLDPLDPLLSPPAESAPPTPEK